MNTFFPSSFSFRVLVGLKGKPSAAGCGECCPGVPCGGLGAQFWSVYVPASMQGKGAVRATMEEIDIVYQLLQRYPDTFQLTLTADEVEAAFKEGKIASMIGIEGGHSIDSSIGALRMFHKLGAGYMTLTHGTNIPWADASTDTAQADGLTNFGGTGRGLA